MYVEPLFSCISNEHGDSVELRSVNEGDMQEWFLNKLNKYKAVMIRHNLERNKI